MSFLAAFAAWRFYTSGYLLYYGDAQAHLNIARSLVDSRTPGYDQLGTVWLPVLHLICLPFASNNFLWQTGLAGTIPVAACFVVSGLCLFLCARQTLGHFIPAFVAVLCYALNPNVLYLASITMTEIVFICGLLVCLLALLRFHKTKKSAYIALAVFASWWMSLTRYDGWFLIPFIAFGLMLGAPENKFRVFVLSGFLASLAPLYWLAHNWYLTANPLDFYNGPYSAIAIQGDRPYPGYHNWPQAIHYYWEAGRLCSGNALLYAGLLGAFIALFKKCRWALLFLFLTPLFYVWSIHGSKTPIHIPTLWPFSYYNTRYGLAVVVFLSFAVGALASILPRRAITLLLPLVSLLPWFSTPINLKESQVNSESRRAWTAQTAAYFTAHYRNGEGILTEFGDLAGIFGKAGINLREATHEGSGPAFFANTMPSGLVRQNKWAIAQAGDKLAQSLAQAKSYSVVETIAVKGAPDVLIYQRNFSGAPH